MRRGCLILGVLAQLIMAMRLETHGLLVSEWREEDKRNKRFYRLSSGGELILKQLLDEWQAINSSLGRVIEAELEPNRSIRKGTS